MFTFCSCFSAVRSEERMSTKSERVVAHDEKSKFFIFRPEMILKNLLNRPKTYKTPRVFKNTQNKRDS